MLRRWLQLPHGQSLKALHQTGKRRPFCKAALASAPQQASTPAPQAVDKPVWWPLVLGCITLTGIAGGGTCLQYDSTIRQVLYLPHPSLANQDGDEPVSADGPGVAGLLAACVVGILPVDELKLALLNQGALEYWSRVMMALNNQVFVVIAVLHNILSGNLLLQAFYAEPKLYAALSEAMMAFLEPYDLKGPYGRVVGSREQLPLGLDGNSLSFTMGLGAALATHPCFLKSARDEHLWEALLMAPGEEDIHNDCELSSAWCAVAASAAQKPTLARFILLDRSIKRRLLEFSMPDGAEAPTVATSKEAIAGKLQKDYALVALHRLALVAASDGVPRVALHRGHWTDEYLHVDLPELPLYAPAQLPQEESQANWTAPCWCLAGGLLWGSLRGLRQHVRAARPVWKTAVITGAGASGLQAAAELARAAKGSMDEGESYSTLRGAMLSEGIDSALWFTLLWFLVQRGRVPFAFGGWVLGGVRLFFT